MRFEPRDSTRCSNHCATGDSMVSKGEMWVFYWDHITQSHSQIMTWHIHCVDSLLHYTVTLMYIKDATNHPPKWVIKGIIIFNVEIASTWKKYSVKDNLQLPLQWNPIFQTSWLFKVNFCCLGKKVSQGEICFLGTTSLCAINTAEGK